MALALGLSLLSNVAVLGVGAVVVFFMMVALNGFSGRKAMPFFLGTGLICTLVNFTVVTVVAALALKSADTTPRWRTAALIGAGFSVIPLLLSILVAWV